MFSAEDKNQLQKKNISPDQIDIQLSQFAKGFPYLNVKKPATPGDGIIVLNEESKFIYTDNYRESMTGGLSVVKFVPASGAATRMFKTLFEFLNSSKEEKSDTMKEGPIYEFLKGISHFAFSHDLQKLTGVDFLNSEEVKNNSDKIVSALLQKDGLNYGNSPKGILKFHLEEGHGKTPIEEHLTEGAFYAVNSNKLVDVVFSVSESHQSLFENVIAEKLEKLKSKFGVNFKITYTYQKPSTDTIAVNPDNSLFRDESGHLVFRPGGHGALLENLNEINSDIIFIKNIDNVVPEYRLKDTIQHKEALAGMLCHFQQKTFDILNHLNEPECNSYYVEKTLGFIEKELNIYVSQQINISDITTQIKFIKKVLNRPMRICGMVKNEGEPGGGPFWVKDEIGNLSLQIVESSQLDLNNKEQADLMQKSTHFNPVDIVAGVRDYRGNKFNLIDFRDPNTGFISSKSMNGMPLKALELPGLWNGAMANWITLFVDVPVATFNPVKTVNDLLRPEHQPQS